MAEDPVTWAALKTTIRAWIDKDTDGFSDAQIEECIAFAERGFNRRLRVPEMELVADLTLDAATEALPADFLEARALYINSDPKTVLEQMSLAELRNTHSAAATGKPQNFAIEGGDTLVLGPAPDTSYTGKLNYYQKITALDGSTADNWLLLAHPDLYLARSLEKAYIFLRDLEAAAVWKGAGDEAEAELKEAGRKKAASAGPIRIRSPYNV